ncbi:hypothetical protein [Komagataeibacter swingsii]|uniref:hypothetical protein n=1 Tax=Komagataeibacter swingsii TaxID=215220 RepID=UPI00142D7572|nr:hypothetical protein [Komagataeibacter swingsii]
MKQEWHKHFLTGTKPLQVHKETGLFHAPSLQDQRAHHIQKVFRIFQLHKGAGISCIELSKAGFSRGLEVLTAVAAAAAAQLRRAQAPVGACGPRKRRASAEEWQRLQTPHYGAVCNRTMFWMARTSVIPLLRP